MAVPVIPALIRIRALCSGLNLNFFRLLLHAVQIPDMVIDPFIVPFRFLCYIDGNKGVILVRTVNHDKNPADLQFASGYDVILKRRILDKLRLHFPGVLHLIKVIARFRFPEDIHGAVVVVIAEGRFADDPRTRFQMFPCALQHGRLVRNCRSRAVYGHLLVGAEHAHGAVAKVIAGVQSCLDFRGDYLQPGPVLIQPQHFRALHAPHKIRFCDRHMLCSSVFSRLVLVHAGNKKNPKKRKNLNQSM